MSDDWRNSANCQGKDTLAFFSVEPSRKREALATCAPCPVAADCLQARMEEMEETPLDDCGIYGGTTPAQRHRLRGKDTRRKPRRKATYVT